jgi:hypothetical protein
VFAVGDVRFGSIKRVGGAIGEGATVVAQLHAIFEKTREGRDDAAPRIAEIGNRGACRANSHRLRETFAVIDRRQ